MKKILLICRNYKTCQKERCWDKNNLPGVSGKIPYDYNYDYRGTKFNCNLGDECCELIPITEFQYLIFNKGKLCS